MVEDAGDAGIDFGTDQPLLGVHVEEGDRSRGCHTALLGRGLASRQVKAGIGP
jgi:hypothetical protein